MLLRSMPARSDSLQFLSPDIADSIFWKLLWCWHLNAPKRANPTLLFSVQLDKYEKRSSRQNYCGSLAKVMF